MLIVVWGPVAGVRAWCRVMRRISAGREVKAKEDSFGGGVGLDFLGGGSMDVFVVLSISRWRLVDFWSLSLAAAEVTDVGGLSLSPGRRVEFLIEQVGWQFWFSMVRGFDTVDCRCSYFLWQLNCFLVGDLRS